MQPCKILLTHLPQGQHLFIYLFSVGQGRYHWFIFIIMLKGREAEFVHRLYFSWWFCQGSLVDMVSVQITTELCTFLDTLLPRPIYTQVIFYTLLTSKTSALVYGNMTNCCTEGRSGMCPTLYPLETSESAVLCRIS